MRSAGAIGAIVSDNGATHRFDEAFGNCQPKAGAGIGAFFNPKLKARFGVLELAGLTA